ncbi:hypothetical protein LCGC14_3029200, partial [marine sediment metagenome]
MSEKSQADPKVQELIDEFQAIKFEPGLRQWEKANKERLKSAHVSAMLAFITHWDGIVGGEYLVSVTDIDIPTLQQKQLADRIDPQESDYKTKRIFTSITWKKRSFVVGKGLEKETFHQYHLSGVHTKGRSRIINPKCKPERLVDHLGEKVAKKILQSKGTSGGTVDRIEIPSKKKKGEQSTEALQLPVMVEGYWEVKFAGKATEEDKNDVEIQWEGRCLQMQREVPVILPGRYIEVNDHAYHHIFMKIGDQPRKIVGKKNHFPATILRECTKE